MPDVLVPMLALLTNVYPLEATRLSGTQSGDNEVVHKLQKNDRGRSTHVHILMSVQDEHLLIISSNMKGSMHEFNQEHNM